MTTLFYAADQLDAAWVAARGGGEVVAPSFAAQTTLDAAGIPYRTFADAAFAVDKEALCDQARRLAAYWHDGGRACGEECLYEGVSVLPLLFHSLTLRFFECLQAHDFVTKVLDDVRPASVVCSELQNDLGLYELLSSPSGLERQALALVCRDRGIPFEGVPVAREKPCAAPITATALVRRKAHSLGIRVKRKLLRPRVRDLSHVFSRKGRRILFMMWGGTYADQVTPVIRYLLGRGVSVGVGVVTGRLDIARWRRLEQMGASVFHMESLPISGAASSILDVRRCATCAGAALRQFFENDPVAGGRGKAFQRLAEDQLAEEMRLMVPQCIANMARMREVLRHLKPDAACIHFAVSASGAAQAAVARACGVPTVTMGHGLHVYTDAERDVFSTDRYCAAGQVHQEALRLSQAADSETVIPCGDPRLEEMSPAADRQRRQAARRFELDLSRPVCVFCDSGAWTQTREKRHSTAATVGAVLELTKTISGLQLLYRVHHGSCCESLSEYFRLMAPDVHFQLAPFPPLEAVLPAADVVVSHMGGAVAEAILSGIPVVCLSALSRREPSLDACMVLKHARTFQELSDLVQEALSMPLTRDEVRAAAKPWLGRVLCGADGKSAERIGQQILRIMHDGAVGGFDDWLARQRVSAAFSSAYWGTLDARGGGAL